MVADDACATGHQHVQALDRSIGEQAAVRGHAGNAQARALREVERFIQRNGQRLGQADELRARPEWPTPLGVVDPDTLADTTGVDVGSGAVDVTGTVAARDHVRRDRLARTGARLHVRWIHRGGAQPYANLVRARLGVGTLADLEHLCGGSVRFVPGGKHRVPFSSAGCSRSARPASSARSRLSGRPRTRHRCRPRPRSRVRPSTGAPAAA